MYCKFGYKSFSSVKNFLLDVKEGHDNNEPLFQQEVKVQNKFYALKN